LKSSQPNANNLAHAGTLWPSSEPTRFGRRKKTNALVAQLDRASDFDSEGREFESLRVRQFCCSEGLAGLSAFRQGVPLSRRVAAAAAQNIENNPMQSRSVAGTDALSRHAKPSRAI
jgi:hypothetical protein